MCKPSKKLKSPLADKEKSSISSTEGNTIGERVKQRRQGNQTKIKQVESKTFFIASGQQKASRNSQLLEEREPQLAQEEQEIITGESGNEGTQEREELDVVATLLATFKHRKAPLTTEMIDLNPKPVSGGSAPFSHFISRKTKNRNQLVSVIERDIIGPERFFEDNTPQKRRFRVRKTSYDTASLHNVKDTFSFERHGEELDELESFITKHFTQWEFQLMLLENLFDSQRVFLNFDLIRKAELIRDYFKVVAAKSIFKIIIHDIDGSLFENREARIALILLSDIPNFHLLAINEKINFFSVWSLIEEDKMNWHAHEVTSFRDYKLSRKAESTKHSGPMTSKKKIEKASQNFKLEKNEAKSVLISFNTHRREMFYILANHIVEAKRRSRITWNSITLNKFFNYCSESLICHEWKTFNLYLEDYYREGIFISNKARSGEIEITIPMPLSDIRSMLLDKDIFGYLNS